MFRSGRRQSLLMNERSSEQWHLQTVAVPHLGRKPCSVPLAATLQLPQQIPVSESSPQLSDFCFTGNGYRNYIKILTLITGQAAESHTPLTQDCKDKLSTFISTFMLPITSLIYYNTPSGTSFTVH